MSGRFVTLIWVGRAPAAPKTVIKRMPHTDFANIPFPAAREMTDHFLATAETAGLRVREYPLVTPDAIPVRGRAGERLASHVVVLGNPEARDTIWITTALHGCEGPAGSILAIWLLHHVRQIEQSLGGDVRLVLAHNLNPWGASFFSRFTRDGVDPNRNFRRRFPSTDRYCSLTPDYRRLDRHLNPRELTLASELWHMGMLWTKSKLVNSRRLMRMVALGQRVDRNKLLFVGRRPSPTNLTTRDIIRRYASDRPGIDLHIDIHTALGRRLTKDQPPLVLTIYDPASPEQRLTQQIYGDVGDVATTRDGEWSGSHVGTIEQAFFDELPAERQYLGSCVELGTVSITNAIAAVWRHQSVLRAPDSYSAWYSERARRLMYDVFYPKDRQWRAEVAPSLHRIVDKAITNIRENRAAFGALNPPSV